VLLDMATLLVKGGDGAQWEALIARARQVAQGQELIELLEIAGLEAESRQEREGARRWWQEALQVGERIPNVMSGRIRDRIATLG
jgi:hypothetical protein